MKSSACKTIAVNIEKGPTITLRSGAVFDFLDPSASQFTIDDIAHGLANICRYAGQCSDFYSVAEHCLLVSRVVEPRIALEALLHDAAEAFLGDVTRPLKQLLPEYKCIEERVQQAIFDRFEANLAATTSIKSADIAVLAAEQAQIMPLGTDAWAAEANVTPAPVVVMFLSPSEAKKAFLDAFSAFKGERHQSETQAQIDDVRLADQAIRVGKSDVEGLPVKCFA
jgi:uncharacterized protein